MNRKNTINKYIWIKHSTRELRPVKYTESNFTCFEPMAAPVISLRGPFHSGVQKILADISFSKCFFRHRYNNARLHYLWTTNAWKTHLSLLLQLKYKSQFPLFHLYWLMGRAAVPWSHRHGTLTPSCHSNNNNFVHFPDACCIQSCSVPYWPLSSLSIPQNYTCPLFAPFSPFPPLLLFLQAPHYPLSAFLIHSPIRIIAFST